MVIPLVAKLKHFYEHSIEIERIVPKLLSHLVGGRLNPTQHLETQQALVKQLAEILEFVLKFDEYKVHSICALHLHIQRKTSFFLLLLLPLFFFLNLKWNAKNLIHITILFVTDENARYSE